MNITSHRKLPRIHFKTLSSIFDWKWKYRPPY